MVVDAADPLVAGGLEAVSAARHFVQAEQLERELDPVTQRCASLRRCRRDAAFRIPRPCAVTPQCLREDALAVRQDVDPYATVTRRNVASVDLERGLDDADVSLVDGKGLHETHDASVAEMVAATLEEMRRGVRLGR